jgi:hypothetical protein
MPNRTELLKIKLDMVYRNIDRATAQTRFQEKTNQVPPQKT